MNQKIIFIAICIVIVIIYIFRSRSGAQKISAKEVHQKITSKESYYLIDVRTPQEYEQGHIPTALSIPNYEIKASAPSRIPEKDSFIIVYCRSGARSANAARTLISLGYTNVHDMGGITSWPFEIEQ